MADNLILVFSGLVALSTIVYAMLTWKLVTETKRMREVQTEPWVSVHAELSDVGHGGLELVIRNEGQGPARNIRFEFQGDPNYFEGTVPLDQLPVIKNGLPYLGPSQTFRFLLGWLFGDSFTRAVEAPWTFHTTYENQAGKPKTDTYLVDFSQFSSLIVGRGSPLYKIEKHLDTLQRDVHQLSTGFNKIRVVTQTKEEARIEMEEFVNQQRARAAADGNVDGADGS